MAAQREAGAEFIHRLRHASSAGAAMPRDCRCESAVGGLPLAYELSGRLLIDLMLRAARIRRC